MDNRAIGVFDSGLGGLTAVKRLRELLPGEDIVYLGDTGRVPYGGRSRETLIEYAKQDVKFLSRYDVKAIVIACNTVSANALEEAENTVDVPVIGVIDPAVKRAAEITGNGKIGVIGTAATIKSGIYLKKIGKTMPEARVTAVACPLLVPLVEDGRIHRGDIVIETVLKEYLEPVKRAGADTLILGCTHYPLLEGIIRDIMGEGVSLINSGGVTAETVAGFLKERGLLADRNPGETCYFVTDDTESFEKTASLFLGESLNGKVSRVSLEERPVRP